MRQAAGLLGAGGQLLTTGPRNITGSILLGSAVSIELDRTGPFVTLSLNTVSFPQGSGGFQTFLNLPVGFRPKGTLRKNLIAADHGHQIAVYANGNVSANVSETYQFREVFVYSTKDAWPSAFPGT